MNVVHKTIAGNSYCYKKIFAALEEHAPESVNFVRSTEEADLAILHINGRWHRFTEYIEKLKAAGKKYIVAQYCIRGTKYKYTAKWRKMWDEAEMVWSYYPLNDYIAEDGGTGTIPNFYQSPLGADEKLFSNVGTEEKRYMIMSSGCDAGQSKIESVLEIIEAARRAGQSVFHLGNILRPYENVTAASGITDLELASYIRSCKYVAGLRRIEAFEMPVVEGLFCGVRPILFDRPHYRIWHDKWGIFIPETGPAEVIQNLVDIFKGDYKPLTNEEREEAVEMFNWKKIITEFWRRCL